MWTTHLGTISYVTNHVHKITENFREVQTNIRISNWTPLQDNLNQKVLLKVDKGSHINRISLGTFQRVFPNKQLNKSMLLLEYYRNSPVSIIGRFTAFIRWKEKVFHQEFHVTNANSLPNLHSRDDCFKMEVSQTCYTVTGKEIHPPQPEPVIKTSQYFKTQKKMEEGSIHSIDPGSVRKSALTKWKI